MLKVATCFRELCKKSDKEMRAIQNQINLKTKEEVEADFSEETIDDDVIFFETDNLR